MTNRSEQPTERTLNSALGRRPRLLDLFCGAGGATRGYQLAGFHVTGVDINPQPHYVGDQFIQAEARGFLDSVVKWRGETEGFDAIHASPPCQAYSDLQKQNKRTYPDLIDSVRYRLLRTGVPYVIENVEGAPLHHPVRLCGTMFPDLRVLRHRLFEVLDGTIPEPDHPRHPLVYTTDKRKAHYGKLDEMTAFVSVNGGGNCSVAAARSAMGIDWMTKDELNEAIPPAYTRYVGTQLLRAVEQAA